MKMTYECGISIRFRVSVQSSFLVSFFMVDLSSRGHWRLHLSCVIVVNPVKCGYD